MAEPTRPAAIDELLAHAAWLRALARRLVASEDVASDVEQETWLAAIEHPPRDASAPRKWLAQVLRNIVKQRRRSESARHAREARVARPQAVEASDESVERAQSLRVLIDGVLELDEPYRSTLLLRYQDGLFPEEIASKQRVPTSTVRNRISRGLAQLRERLERRHGNAWSSLLLPLVHHDATATAAATAGGGALGASVAVLTSMATLKLVSAAAAVIVIGATLWWTLSDAQPATPRASFAQPAARAEPTLDEQSATASTERAVVEAPKPTDSPLKSAQVGTRGSLVVTVTWESDGSPASDVVVHVHPWGESSPFAFATSRATDAQGRARFDDVANGSVSVETDRAEGEMAQVRGGEETKLALTIPRGVFVRGRVVDSADAPVGFARIWLSQYFNGDQGDEVTTADAGGRFMLRDVGEARRIAARAAGFAPSFSTFVRGKPGDEVEVVIEMLASGGELRGVVRAPDGIPVAGAAVLVGYEGTSMRQTKSGAEAYSPPPFRLTTDQHGGFVARGVALGRVRVQSRERDFAPFASSVEIIADGVTNLAIELGPGAAVEGVVLGADGQPANKVNIDTGEYGDFASNHTSTALDGSFRLAGLTPGEAALRIRGDAQGEADATVMLIAGETARLDVQLKKHGIVAGRVIDENGAPVVGWRVGAITADHPGLHHRTSITDAEGNFKLDNWPAKANALEVREADRWTGSPALFLDKVEIGRTDLVLTVATTSKATAFFVGRLRGPNGEVVADATLVWGEPGANQRSFAELSATTGEFRAGPMRPGRHELQADSPSMGTLRVPERELDAGETLDIGEVRFSAPGRVRVKVVGPRELLDTLDAKSVYVSLLGPGRLWRGQIELDGKLEGLSAALEAGEYTIEVSSSNLRAPKTSVALLAGEEHAVEIALERATSRSVRVSWDSSAPPKESFDFTVIDAAGNVFQQMKLMPQKDGSSYVGVQGLAVGTYWIEVKTTDGRGARVSFVVDDLGASDELIDIPLR